MIVPHNIELHRTSILLSLADTVFHAMHAPNIHTYPYNFHAIWFGGSRRKTVFQSILCFVTDQNVNRIHIYYMEIWTHACRAHFPRSTTVVECRANTANRPNGRDLDTQSVSHYHRPQWMVEQSAHTNTDIQTRMDSIRQDERFTQHCFDFCQLQDTKQMKQKKTLSFLSVFRIGLCSCPSNR